HSTSYVDAQARPERLPRQEAPSESRRPGERAGDETAVSHAAESPPSRRWVAAPRESAPGVSLCGSCRRQMDSCPGSDSNGLAGQHGVRVAREERLVHAEGATGTRHVFN